MSDPSTTALTPLPPSAAPEPPAPEPTAAIFDPATVPPDGTADHDAEAASGLRIHRDPSLTAETATPDQGEGDRRRRIEWVRPTDLVARVSARASERGVEWNVRAHEWARTQARATISDTRTKVASMGRSVSATLTRTGPDPAEQKVARL